MKVGTDGVLLGAWCGKDLYVTEAAPDGTPLRRAFCPGHILDIGTGTGLIALMAAQRFPEARVTGIDIDASAIEEARLNVGQSPFAGRTAVCHLSFQDFLHSHDTLSEEMCDSQPASSAVCPTLFDLIVSNPPFYDQSLENPDPQRSLARHTSALPFAELIEGAFRLLASHGIFCVILPTEVYKSFCTEASIAGFHLMRHTAVKTVARKQPRRHLLAFAKTPSLFDTSDAMIHEEHCLSDASGNRSEWYHGITNEFYL